MAPATRNRGGRAAWFIFVPLLAGCPNPNTYSTPRTLPPGKFSHTLAAELGYVEARQPGGNYESKGAPLAPTYQLRAGLGERTDMGFRLTNLDGVGVDFKWNFLRGRVDMALDPGVQVLYVIPGSEPRFGAVVASAPLIVGYNLSETVAAVLTPGVMATTTFGRHSAQVEYALVEGGLGFLARMGVGMNFEFKGHSIMPELTVMKSFNVGEGLFVLGGVGVAFGDRPPRFGSENAPPTGTSSPPAACVPPCVCACPAVLLPPAPNPPGAPEPNGAAEGQDRANGSPASISEPNPGAPPADSAPNAAPTPPRPPDADLP